ncbi:hypothetical protein Z517_07037 [Fonsecaea pedrosoi CBS 271.37]|uniref:Cytochrome P450 n=1 Tax=Fonsecaea pedrosoi CBS 271.37 TaxID=1442368 RepID=A0A0D2F1D7_9EURO|nr:uncharacterized protein Z517_07037 [Fonsecaea pedrosoi CBS 271.37]KIW80422.1 hypothetical protein Z517_07037 [Fonsecaea pedrosoi CBS 271.37]
MILTNLGNLGHNAPAWAIVLLLLFLWLGGLFVQSYRSRRRRLPLPPGPPRLPIIGNLHQAPQVYPWRVYQEWTRQYGPVFSLQYGMNTVIMLGTYQAAHELLNKRSHIYSSRPRAVMGGECLSRGLRTLLMPYGQQWRNHQRLQASYLNVRVSQSYRGVQDLESKQLLYEFLSPGVDFVDRYHRYSSSVIFALAYGRRLPKGDEPEIQAIDEVMKNFLYAARVGTWLVDAVPILNYLPKFLAPWRRLGDRLHKLESTLCIDNMTKGLDSASWNWSKHVSGMKEGRDMSTKELAYDVGIIYEAGSDTTSMALEIFTLAMLVYPDVMKKAQAEIDAHVGGDDRLPGFEDKDSLPYMDAMIKEVLRWRPVSAGGIPHAVIQDDEYLGYRIPAGATVIGNHWSIHLDEDVYRDPHAFNPDRWIEDPALPLAPFGFGRRVCTGQHLARNSLFINMVRILWAFDVVHAHESVPEIDPHTGRTVLVRRRCEVDPLAFTQGLNSKPLPFRAEFKVRSPERARIVQDQWDKAEKRLDVLLERIRADVGGSGK